MDQNRKKRYEEQLRDLKNLMKGEPIKTVAELHDDFENVLNNVLNQVKEKSSDLKEVTIAESKISLFVNYIYQTNYDACEIVRSNRVDIFIERQFHEEKEINLDIGERKYIGEKDKVKDLLSQFCKELLELGFKSGMYYPDEKENRYAELNITFDFH